MRTEAIHSVVRCGHLVDGVFDTLRSLTTGRATATTGAIVASPDTPAIADEWLRSVAAGCGFDFIRVPSDRPGAAWNAGLVSHAGARLALCVDAGDSLAPDALWHLAHALAAAPDSSFATPGMEWVGPGTSRSITGPHGGTPTQILVDTHPVHASSLFRMSLWTSGLIFDEQLPALEHADFWIRISQSASGVPVPAACVRRRVHARALYKALWGTPAYQTAAQTLFARHADTVAAADVLYGKECALQRGYQHRAAMQERAARLTAERANLLDEQRRERSRHPSLPTTVDFGSFRRTTPVTHDWGYSRGTPVDRPLIDRFLAAHRDDIRGRVLEVQEDDYTRRFGGPRVTHSDVLDVNVANSRATVFADLRDARNIADGQFDCIILTQTLHVVDDMAAVIRECFRILRPGGALLATLPCSSRVCLEYGPEGDYWRVTEAGVRTLATLVFPPSAVDTVAVGNALVNAAFTFGLAGEDLPQAAWKVDDPYFPSVVGLRARKPGPSGPPTRWHRAAPGSPVGVVLMYHRVTDAALDPFDLCVSPSRFRAQLEWLSAVGTLVPLAEIAARETRQATLQFALTFDDGYVDNLTHAAPLLTGAAAPATFFLTTATGPEPYRYWWDRLNLLLSGDGPRAITLELPSGEAAFSLETAPEREAAVRRIHEAVVGLPPAARDRVIDAAIVSAGAGRLESSTRRMTWDEARLLNTNPLFEIGGHTGEHLLLPAQPPGVVEAALLESRLALQRELGGAVTSLAYPFGAFDHQTIALAQTAGYRVAVTCDTRAVTRLDDPLALPRMAVTDDPLEVFANKVERLVGQRLR